MEFFRQMLVIAGKDLRAELRTKEAINASLAFALVILLLFSFAFDPTEETTREISGGLLWIVFAFAGTLVLNRSFARELPNDCLDALVVAPISAAALFMGKVLANFVLVLAVELVSLPVFGIFYNVQWTKQFWALLLVLVAGYLGIDGHRDDLQRAHREHTAARVDASVARLSRDDSGIDGGHALEHRPGCRQADQQRKRMLAADVGSV